MPTLRPRLCWREHGLNCSRTHSTRHCGGTHCAGWVQPSCGPQECQFTRYDWRGAGEAKKLRTTMQSPNMHGNTGRQCQSQCQKWFADTSSLWKRNCSANRGGQTGCNKRSGRGSKLLRLPEPSRVQCRRKERSEGERQRWRQRKEWKSSMWTATNQKESTGSRQEGTDELDLEKGKCEYHSCRKCLWSRAWLHKG